MEKDIDRQLALAEDESASFDLRFAAWRGIWAWLEVSNQLERAQALATRMRVLAEEEGRVADAIRADIVVADVIALAPGPQGEAIRLAEDAQVEAAGLGYPELEARAMVVLGSALGSVGSFHTGIDCLLRAKRLLREMRDEDMLAWTDLRLSRVLNWADEPSGSARTAERAQRWARSHGDLALVAGTCVQRAVALVELGELQAARLSAEEGLMLSQRHGFALFEGEALVSLGDCASAEGRLDAALARYLQALESFGEFPSLLLRLGSVRYRLGDSAGAQAYLERVVEMTVNQGYTDIEYAARDLLAVIAEERGDFAEALEQTRLARSGERSHRAASFDRRVSEMLAGFEVERLSREAAEERDRRAELERMAVTDPLTDLFNRRGLHAAASSLDGEPFALLMLDLDRFKAVNDECGHDVGDEVLRRVARALVSAAPSSAVVARLGGDEFVVLLPECEAEQAQAVVKALLAALADVDIADIAVGHRVGASIGCSHRRGGEGDLDSLLRTADRALYRAKAEGIGMFCSDLLD